LFLVEWLRLQNLRTARAVNPPVVAAPAATAIVARQIGHILVSRFFHRGSEPILVIIMGSRVLNVVMPPLRPLMLRRVGAVEKDTVRSFS
jgi:hypothetical protein